MVYTVLELSAKRCDHLFASR